MIIIVCSFDSWKLPQGSWKEKKELQEDGSFIFLNERKGLYKWSLACPESILSPLKCRVLMKKKPCLQGF